MDHVDTKKSFQRSNLFFATILQYSEETPYIRRSKNTSNKYKHMVISMSDKGQDEYPMYPAVVIKYPKFVSTELRDSGNLLLQTKPKTSMKEKLPARITQICTWLRSTKT